MLQTLRSAWKIEDLRKKIIFTLSSFFSTALVMRCRCPM